MTLHPRHWAERDPERPAIIFEPSGYVLSYGALVNRSNRCAQFLLTRGTAADSTIALLIENHPAFFEIAWAAQNAGIIYTPISWRFQAEEIAFILRDCGATLLFISARQQHLLDILGDALDGVEVVTIGFERAGYVTYDAMLDAQPAAPPPVRARGTDMVYSSGSTGRPKGIRQSLSETPIDALTPLFAIFAERFGWDRDTIYMMPAPLYHSGPLRFSMAMQHVGATLIVMEKFDAATALDLIAKHRVTHGHFVPTMMVRLLKLPAEIRAKANLSSLKIILHGAGPCAPEVKYAMIDWVGPILEESYGGSEGNGMTIINSTEWLAHPGSVGRSFAGSLHILDDDGRELPIGETGLVYFSGGQAFEYHGNPELTKAAYRGAELSTLGDIGYLDAESYLFLTDRKNNMIVTGAVNVFPQEIEHVLIMDPDIVDVVVFGIPDVEMGEIIVAAVQPRSMDLAGGALATRLERLCRAQLAGYKTPRRFLFEHHLPRHETGKIYIGELKNKL